MQLPGEPTLLLLDAQDRSLGTIHLESQAQELLLGRFAAEPAFAAVEPLFRAWQHAVDSQALSVVDDLDRAIAALQLRVQTPHATPARPVCDVQIWSDGGISCRLNGPLPLEHNGMALRSQPIESGHGLPH